MVIPRSSTDTHVSARPVPHWLRGLFYSASVFLVLCFGLVAFRHLGTHAFNAWDESIYAEVAKESLLHHNQVSLTFFGKPWYEKPPLMIWLTELGFASFGITEFGGRFFVALFAIGLVVLTWFLIRELFNKASAALVGLAAFFLCFQFLEVSHYLYFDIPVSFFILLSTYAFVRVGKGSPRWWYVFWASLAV